MKKYFSPFHLLDSTGTTAMMNSAADVRRLKKELLAEFELAGTTTILLASREMDKDELLRFFEQLERENAMDLHYKIFQNRLLLQFLEEGNLLIFKTPHALEKVARQESLFRFVLPYFLAQFNDLLCDAVRRLDVRQTRLLTSKIALIPPKKEGEAFQKTYRYLKSQSLALESIGKRIQKEYVLDSEIIDYLHPTFTMVFNLLPAGYFANLRNEYALRLETVALHLYNYARRREMAMEALETGLELDVSENTAHRLRYVLQQIEPNNKKKAQRSKRAKRTSTQPPKRDVGTMLFWGVQILLLIYFALKYIASWS